MNIGFSLYDTLLTYTGQTGVSLSDTDLMQAIHIIGQQINPATNIALRLPITLRLQTKEPAIVQTGGYQFITTTEAATMTTTPAYERCLIADDDMLAFEYFIISYDPDDAFVFVAQHQQNGYIGLFTIDEMLIDLALTVISQYWHGIYQPLALNNSGYHNGGRLAVHLAHHIMPELISSWVSQVLLATPQNRLHALQQSLGAIWCDWNGTTTGPRPNTSDFLTERITVPGGQTFTAMGYPGNPDFATRCMVAAALLAELGHLDQTQTSPTPPMDGFTPVRELDLTHLPDTLFDESAWDDAAWPELDAWPELNAYSPDESLPLLNDEPSQIMPLTASPPPPQAQIDVPDANIEVLNYINREISFLRDRIMDAGLYRALADQPRSILDTFISRSGDLVLLIDEIIYLQKMVDEVLANHELLSPYDALNAIVMTYSGEAERRGVTLHYDAPDDLPPVIANIEAINRALAILLEEGIDHAAPKGQVTIGATHDSTYLNFFVWDSGAPISDADLQQLFVPRFDNTDSSTPHLGMAALKPIIEAHYGQFDITRQDNGNYMRFRLPLNFTQFAQQANHQETNHD